jgi:Holliday junction resolvasome RuvABC endonuclease subunit
MRIVSMGIDQSYNSCGVVFIDQDQNLLEFFKLSSNKEDDIYARSQKITNEISSLIDKFSPNVVGLEGLAFSKFGNATRDLAGLQFTIVHRIRYYHNLRGPIIVAPNMLKKFVIKGNATKDEMVANLPTNVLDSFKLRNLKKTTGLYDMTDAYWIARFTLDQSPVIDTPEPNNFSPEQIRLAIQAM